MKNKDEGVMILTLIVASDASGDLCQILGILGIQRLILSLHL
jgi:hypothetical protein